MQRGSACWGRQEQPAPPAADGGSSSSSSSSSSGTCRRSDPRKLRSGPGAAWALLLFLLAFGASACKGAPMAPHVLQGEPDLQLSNEIDDVCSTYMVRDSPSQSSNTLEELCYMILELLHKAQESDEKDNTKRSSVLHPLLQLVPQLKKRLKRYKADEELRIPGGIQSRGYFIFRPRNGRRSTTFR
ncbi:neuromedin-U isoform X2 [Podarcis raffonei]|uniref:neuromedin-U isoform X2 n=1 Tax=Podarcis raffonei TaxID=65483 RepID=UPI0023295ECB|nr:neuromedin-U isoform X2 [Podarcis raffonei]